MADEPIILGTGSYATVKSGNTVSITGDGGNAWEYFGPAYKKLAPKLVTYKTYADKLEILKTMQEGTEAYKLYRESIEDEYMYSYYNTRLKDLNVRLLLGMLEEKFGNNIIFLCHEPIDKFCHRRPLVDYMEIKTGIYIPEVGTDIEGNVKKYNPIRYKKRLINIINNS